MDDSPPESLADAQSSQTAADGIDVDVRRDNKVRDEWTPYQRQNWREVGKPIYENLQTDGGRYWFRRCYRPKYQHTGMLPRDHVTIDTPDHYIVSNVDELLTPGGDGDIQMKYRRIVGVIASEHTLSEVNRAVKDIVNAKSQTLPEDTQRRLPDKTKEIQRQLG